MKGNGNQFTVKEILQAHIIKGDKFESFVREEFEKGNTQMTENKTKIEGIAKVLKYGVAPILIMIIGYMIGTSLI